MRTPVIRKETYVTPQQDARIKVLAARKGVTEAEIIRQALDLFLAQQERGQTDEEPWLEGLIGAFTGGAPRGSETVDEIYRRSL